MLSVAFGADYVTFADVALRFVERLEGRDYRRRADTAHFLDLEHSYGSLRLAKSGPHCSRSLSFEFAVAIRFCRKKGAASLRPQVFAQETSGSFFEGLTAFAGNSAAGID